MKPNFQVGQQVKYIGNHPNWKSAEVTGVIISTALLECADLITVMANIGESTMEVDTSFSVWELVERFQVGQQVKYIGPNTVWQRLNITGTVVELVNSATMRVKINNPTEDISNRLGPDDTTLMDKYKFTPMEPEGNIFQAGQKVKYIGSYAPWKNSFVREVVHVFNDQGTVTVTVKWVDNDRLTHIAYETSPSVWELIPNQKQSVTNTPEQSSTEPLLWWQLKELEDKEAFKKRMDNRYLTRALIGDY